MVWLISLEEEERFRPEVCNSMFGIEMRITCSYHRIYREEPCSSVIGVEAVPFPRVVAEHHVWLQPADFEGNSGHQSGIGGEKAIDLVEEDHFAGGSECGGRDQLFSLAGADQGFAIRCWIPRAFGAIGAHQKVNRAARSCPTGQRCTSPELDVIGVGTNGERDLRYGQRR